MFGFLAVDERGDGKTNPRTPHGLLAGETFHELRTEFRGGVLKHAASFDNGLNLLRD